MACGAYACRCVERRHGARPRGGRARAFTLLELIVVIVIILAISAVVLPVAFDDVKRAAFREAQEQIEAVMMSARADAQRTGKTVRVTAVRVDGRWVMRQEEIVEGGSHGAAMNEVSGGARTRLMHEKALPLGMRLARSLDELTAAEGMDGTAEWGASDDAGGDVDGRDEDAAMMQIGMFLPDGQITPTRPLYLAEGDVGGRVGEVIVNSWTGVVTVKMVDVTNVDGLEEDEGAAAKRGG